MIDIFLKVYCKKCKEYSRNDNKFNSSIILFITVLIIMIFLYFYVITHNLNLMWRVFIAAVYAILIFNQMLHIENLYFFIQKVKNFLSFHKGNNDSYIKDCVRINDTVYMNSFIETCDEFKTNNVSKMVGGNFYLKMAKFIKMEIQRKKESFISFKLIDLMNNLLSDILVAFVSAALTIIITNNATHVDIFVKLLNGYFNITCSYVPFYYIIINVTDYLNKKSDLNNLEETVDWYISMYEE